MGLAQRLSGAHILLTGSTGFVGEAFLQRIMEDLPDTRITLIVRGSKGQGAQERAEFLLTKSAFKPMADRLGADQLAAIFKARVTVIEAELGQPLPTLPHDIDVLVHCAGEVSFDPPIDEGFRTNLLGTQGLLEAVRATGVTPHVLHVSTAYVAGLRSGWVLEETHPHHVNWRAEAENAERQKQLAEDASREPVALEELLAEAAKAMGGAGPQALAVEAERLRVRWVRKRLQEAGRLRARTLGWADCYTFTKALTERMVEEFCADWGVPLSIYRPTIIESALEKPSPGWIEGFKMAEPIIISFGRGDLSDFPASPDAAIDVIPVDIVVASMVAIAASPPPVGEPAYYQVGSSARNPLRFEYLYGTVLEYFTEHPLPKRDRGHHNVPTWPFSPAHAIERRLALGERAIKVADKAVGWIPPSGLARKAATKVDKYGGQLRSLRRLSDLYEAYTQAELYYSDDNTLALFRSLDEADQKLWAFDSEAVDWHHYLVDLHYPAVTGLLRFAAAMPARPKPVRRELDGHAGKGQIIAAFDMDGTLLASTVVEAYLWTKLADTPNRAMAQLREVADLAGDLPSLLMAERRSRAGVIRAIGKRYEGADPAALAALVDSDVASAVLERLSPAAVRTVREHQRAGHRTVLITGGLEVLTRPLRPLFDEIEAVGFALDEDGLATGRLAKPPVVGEARAAWLRRRAKDEGWDLAASFAYADSHSDLPMLQAVGHPVLVNPDVVMQRLAKRSKWPIVEWKMTPGTPRLPLAQLAGKASR